MRVIAVDNLDGCCIPENRHPPRLNHQVVDVAVGRRGNEALGVHLPHDFPTAFQRRLGLEARGLALHVVNGLGNAGDGLVPVSDRLETRPFPRNKPVEIRTDVVVFRASRTNAFEVGIGDSAMVVVVVNQPRHRDSPNH